MGGVSAACWRSINAEPNKDGTACRAIQRLTNLLLLLYNPSNIYTLQQIRRK